MRFSLTGMLAVALVAMLQIAEVPAQPLPVMGYVAAKNAKSETT